MSVVEVPEIASGDRVRVRSARDAKRRWLRKATVEDVGKRFAYVRYSDGRGEWVTVDRVQVIRDT